MELDYLNSRRIELAPGEALGLRSGAPTRLRVLDGRVWITEERLLEDIFGGAGYELGFSGRGKAVVEALGEAPVRLLLIEPSWGARTLHALRSEAAARLERWAARLRPAPACSAH